MRLRVSYLVRCVLLVVITMVAINVLVMFRSTPTSARRLGPKQPIISQNTKVLPKNLTFQPAPVTTAKPTVPQPVVLISKESCPGLQVMIPPKPIYEFQAIPGYPAYVYSAFLEKTKIRIISIRQKAVTSSVYCQIWYHSSAGDPLRVSEGTFENLPEDHGRKFSATFLVCPLPQGDDINRQIPIAVSVSTSKCAGGGDDVLRVSNLVHLEPVPDPAQNKLDEFVVCVTPLNMHYSKAYELVEMMEMNKLLGASKVVFYNHTTGLNVDRVLDYYIRRGEALVLPWSLPVKVDHWPPQGLPEIHYFGQLASHNECLYRYRHKAKWLVYQDLDEFIIPEVHGNWSEMIQSRTQYGVTTSAYQFRCVFFRKEWAKVSENFEGNSIALRYNSVLLQHTLREGKIFPFDHRSKYIVNPLQTSIVGIHNLWQQSGIVDKVPESVALLHHYRTWENPNDLQPRISDEIVVKKYGKALVNKLQTVWNELGPIPLDIDIKAYGPYV